jgi:hypothetical protein
MKNNLTRIDINRVRSRLEKANQQDFVNLFERLSYEQNATMYTLLYARLEECKDWEQVKKERGLK